jgi:2-phospho-L-lactate guanylyltransferase
LREVCIIPFKGKDRKSRLSSFLSSDQREFISKEMFLHVFKCACKVFGRKNIYVVTSDNLAKFSSKIGFNIIKEDKDKGVNAAVEYAFNKVKADKYFIVPSDLPVLTAAELKFSRKISKILDVVIAPSHSFNGTNLLGFKKGVNLELSYDVNSFWNHFNSASKNGLSVAVLGSIGLINDLDTVDDIRRLIRINRGIMPKVRKIWKKE